MLRCFGFGLISSGCICSTRHLRLIYKLIKDYSCPSHCREVLGQECPLSPTVFALALEPLAILIRNSERVQGLREGSLEEKISLYVDNALLYLKDADESLQASLDHFKEFVRF